MRARVALVIAAVLGAAAPSPAQVAARGPLWSLDLGLQERYHTGGQQARVAGSDFVTYLDARLGRRFPMRRTSFDLGLTGGAAVDHAVGDLRRFTWGVAASASHALSRRGRLQGSVGSSLGYARDVGRLDESGVVPPYHLARTDRASVELQHSLPADLQGSVAASGERFSFDSPELVDGSTAGVDADVGRALGPRFQAGVSGGYRRSSSSGTTVQIGRLSGRVRVMLARELSLALHGGFSRYRVVEEGEVPHVAPLVGATLTGSVGRHTVSAGVGQSVEQTYGLGTIGVSRSAFLRYNYSFNSRLAVDGAVRATRVSESVVGQGPDRGLRYTAGASYHILRNLSGAAHYTYWRRGAGADEWNSHSVAVSLRTHFAWR